MRAYRKHPLKTFEPSIVMLAVVFTVIDATMIKSMISQSDYDFLTESIILSIIVIMFFVGYILEYRRYKKEVPGLMIENDIFIHSKTNGTKIKIAMFLIKDVKLLDSKRNEISFRVYKGPGKRHLTDVLEIKYYKGNVFLTTCVAFVAGWERC